jgi:RNA polymerase II elongation factor ELL
MEHLRDRWTGKDEDFRPALEKVADCAPDSKLWNMKKVYWKELDVWNYDYDTEAERQKAIDNAVRQFDRQRLSASEPEWQKLLPKEERGKGKCLSRLQTTLAKGPAPAAPKIKVQKADDGSGSKHDGDNLGGKTGGESMSRSSSSNGPSKPKKPSAADAQAKRLLGSSKAKTASSKTSPSKGKVGGSKTNGNPPLSQEYVYDSDSSGEETSLAKPAPKGDVVKDTVVVTAKPPAKAPTKEQPAKRPHEDDDSSSSSGTPLAKRHKQRPTPQPSKLKEREGERERDRERERERERRREQPAEPKQKSRGPATTSTARPKNTSPTKSSPLASSPPTNASDMETDRAPVAKKRKAELEMKPATVKRRAPSRVSLEVMTKANKFKEYYQKYQTLHRQIADLDNPPDEKVANLLNMRGRLVNMKKEIYRECSPV